MPASKSESKTTIVAATITAIAAIVVALIHYYPQPRRDIPAPRQALRIAGTVVDSESKLGVGQARIVLSGRTEGYITEDNGNFEIEVASKEKEGELLRVRVSKNGYDVYDESVRAPSDRLIIQLKKVDLVPSQSPHAVIRSNDAEPAATVNRGPVPAKAAIVDLRHITYQVDSCEREGSSSLACRGFVTNNGDAARRILLISEQRGGIRSTALDGLGRTKAIDELANEYAAKQISLANQGSPDTGQFFYDLRPGLHVPLTIRFNNFDANAKSLYSLEIHGSDGTALDVVFPPIPVAH